MNLNKQRGWRKGEEVTDAAFQQLMKHAHRLAMDGHGELAQFLRDAIDEAARAKLEQAEPVWLDAEILHFARTALHEMPRPATEWHHCAKRVCEAVVAQHSEPVQAEPDDSGNPSY